MKWIESQSSAIMEGNQELVWDKLIAALGLPNKLYIPFYDISENINQDTIYQGMRLEVISVVTKEQIPLTLSVWLPDERDLRLLSTNQITLIWSPLKLISSMLMLHRTKISLRFILWEVCRTQSSVRFTESRNILTANLIGQIQF